MRRFAFLLLGLLLPLTMLGGQAAWAWGAEGHEIVALIAERELTPAARQQMAQLLGSDAMMVHDANWADEIRSQRPETGGWHYVDIPLGAPGYAAWRDCRGGNCVVAQIADDVKVLRDRALPPLQRTEALRYLIHFVGDIHQPLHAVDNDDKGGNAIRVRLGHDRTNLHHVWDVQVVEALGYDASAVADACEAEPTSAQKASWRRGTPQQWAEESFAIARGNIYPPLQGRRNVMLPVSYPRAQAHVTCTQLAKAGVRLAWLLNETLR
jgi:hypothetical protein